MHVFFALPVDEGLICITIRLHIFLPITIDIFPSLEDVLVKRHCCLLILQGLCLLNGWESIIFNIFLYIVAISPEVSTVVHRESFHGIIVFFRRVLYVDAKILTLKCGFGPDWCKYLLLRAYCISL